MSLLHLDFETRSLVDLKKCGADVYARHPSTEVLCIGYAFDDEPVRLWEAGTPFPTELSDAQCDPTVTFAAHNASFELVIWNNVLFRQVGCVSPITPDRFVCTMAMAYAMALPGSLEDAAPAAGLTMNKDSTGHRVMLQLSQPRDTDDKGRPVFWTKEEAPHKFEALYAYCKQDIEVERALYRRLLKLSPSEYDLWKLDRTINDRGVYVDLNAVKVALELVDAETRHFNAQVKWLTKDQVATITATAQLKAWLQSQGLKVEGVAKADVLELLERDDLSPVVRQVLKLRQASAKSSNAKLEAMRRGVCEDGRLRGMFQYCGAGATGRFAGRRVQLHNMPRPKLEQKDIDFIFNLFKQAESS